MGDVPSTPHKPDGNGDNLSVRDQQLVGLLVSKDLKGYGKGRLSKFTPHVLARLVRIYYPDAQIPDDHDAKVEMLLTRKQTKKAPPPPPPSPCSNDDDATTSTSIVTCSSSPPTPSTPTPSTQPKATRNVRHVLRPVFCHEKEKDSAFKASNHIDIVAFNALKLRLDHPDLQDAWTSAVEEFLHYDVIVLSEVPAGERLFQKRLLGFKDKLNDTKPPYKPYSLTYSTPSGATPADRAKEVHAVFVRHPLELLAKPLTHERIGTTDFGHAPFSVAIRVPFFSDCTTLVVTSVHLPPDGSAEKRTRRNAQAALLFKEYAGIVRSELSLPFTRQAAKEARQLPAAHILCGDFNMPGSALEDAGANASNGWRVGLGDGIATSSGKKAYDNFVVNADVAFRMFALSFNVLTPSAFQNSARSQIGISDHAAITLRMSEIG